MSEDELGVGEEFSGETEKTPESRLEQASDEALDFLEGLLDAMELEGEVQAAVSPPDQMTLSLSGEQSALLIGRKGKTLDALQDLVRAVVQRQVGPGLKVSLDVEGYRERRRQAIEQLTSEVIQEALENGEAELEPMSSYERKLVHDIVALNEEVTSFSEGRDPDRRVVIRSTG
ncbi:MAG: protein jag [Actinomycetota bacterium]